MYGTFTWTKYIFVGDATKLSSEHIASLRRLSTGELEGLLEQVRSQRWTEFRDEHRRFIQISVVAAACIPLMLIAPIFALGPYLGALFALSLAVSAVSRARALSAEMKFLRAAHARAQRIGVLEDEALRLWEHICSTIRRTRPLLVSWVESARGLELSAADLIVYYPPSEQCAMEALLTQRNFTSLQNALAEIRPLKLHLRITPDTAI